MPDVSPSVSRQKTVRAVILIGIGLAMLAVSLAGPTIKEYLGTWGTYAFGAGIIGGSIWIARNA
jgi:hypothetical protein